jgi:hypothetical protein
MTNFLRNLFLEDFWLKLFSLALAILIWLTVTYANPKDARTEKRVYTSLPVTILAATEDVHNFKVTPSEVVVTVEADFKTMQKLEVKDIRPMVDLTRVGPARDLMTRIQVAVPAGVKPVQVTPEQVQVIFPPDR